MRARIFFRSMENREFHGLSRPNSVPSHQCRERTKRHAVAGKAGGRELMLGGFADVGQAIIGFHDLTRPAMVDLGLRNELPQRFFQAGVTRFRIVVLACFVILAPENNVVSPLTRFHAGSDTAPRYPRTRPPGSTRGILAPMTYDE